MGGNLCKKAIRNLTFNPKWPWAACSADSDTSRWKFQIFSGSLISELEWKTSSSKKRFGSLELTPPPWPSPHACTLHADLVTLYTCTMHLYPVLVNTAQELHRLNTRLELYTVPRVPHSSSVVKCYTPDYHTTPPPNAKLQPINPR